ncbi:putative PurR-regulated permease PerM [Prosthecobacter fusiformis]|uniref:Putative PurR-regulated permease PerM n=1 Tax=Prosthecobacter fusiformis TaxID=48464 RepID=A0A4V3FED3_9BACT|nr:AI-2E family transporter [Prosthecobacter fusiformis]TDU66563.1 putative PurR-regulated permease PerM [Prosthecobacter fusiformis]
MEALQLQLAPLIRLATVMLTVAMLWSGREFFIPLALAALFAFLLKPVVSFFNHKLHFPRTVAVILVTLLSFSVLGSLVWGLGVQLHELAKDLPGYRTTMHQRMVSLRQVGEGGVLEKLQSLVQEISNAPKTPEEELFGAPKDEAPVFIEKSTNQLQESAMTVVSYLADSLGMAAIVIVFVIFMLLRQNDVRNRVIQLVGYSRLTTTTRALDEAASRVSRYLLMQTLINSVYGLLLALGFWAIGLPYMILWGALAALFRFVPYIGPWIAAILPLALSLAVFDGWTQPLMVLTLITSLELLTNMILEPLLYGQSAGVSDLSLLVAIVFWTWIWGPVGLLLATPLTVCLVVFSKYIPELRHIEILMGEKSEVQPALLVYQRLLVGDIEEAEQLHREMVRDIGQEKTIDLLLLPAAVHARREMLAGKLSKEEVSEILETLSSLSGDALEESPPPPAAGGHLVLCRSLDASADAIALRWLARNVAPGQVQWESIPQSALVSEVIAQVNELKPEVVCISAMPPGVSSTAQLLCKRLRHRFPELKILLARWGAAQAERSVDTGATWVVTTAEAARERLEDALHVQESSPKAS